MRRRIALFWMAVLMGIGTSLSAAVTYCASSAFGYSTATGGSGTPVLVSSIDGLKKALNKANNKVIIITANLTFTSMVSVQDGSNVTLLGLPGVTLTSTQQDASNSGILYVKRFTNLIIRNLTFVGPGAYDCDGNDLLCFQDVTNAWVDHCDFQDGVDGNFDNKNGTDNVTVSWCRFRYLKAPKPGGKETDDHRFTNLLGAKSSDAPSDGTYNFTWAYCWWDEGCKERMVRCRNAELHFLNCYWNSSVANYYVGPENAKAYFEGCTFEGKANSSSKIFKSYGGTNACKFIDCSGKLPSDAGTVDNPSSHYSYTASGREEAKTAVTNSSCGAGATLTVTPAGVVSSTCDSGIEPISVFTVLWDATTNGGICATISSEFEEGSAIGTLPVATKTDCSFDGWFTEPSGGEMITSATTVSTSVTYYAQFTSSGSGGGGGSDCDKIFAFANDVDVPTGVTNSTSTFSGFSTGGNKCTGSITIDGTTYSVTKRGSNSTFTITFSVPEGKIGTLYGLANSNGSTQRTLTLKSGSIYSATQKSSTSSSSAKAITYTDMPAGDYTLKSSGSASVPFLCLKLCDGVIEPITLTYDENGGSGTMAEEIGKTFTVKSCAFTPPTGYEFDKWNSEMNGSGTDYIVGQNITLTEGLTLYAIWTPKTYTVTLNKDGGSGGPASVTATFDEAMPSATMPTKSSSSFLGYFTEKNGAGTQYYDADGNSMNNWTTASNATLYAAWGPTSTPEGDCNLDFWFFNSADATANSKSNNDLVFKNMVAASSTLSGSITIDGLSYSVTQRTGDPEDGVFGKFTVYAGQTGVFYALAVSSGAGDRQINLVSDDATYELSVPGGSSSYKRIESGVLPAGTYTIKREGGNVRLAVAVVKMCAASSGTKKVYLKAPEEGNERFAVYCYGSGDKWYDMTLETDDECEGKIYSAEVETKYTGYVFCRLDKTTTGYGWSNPPLWDQTGDMDASNVFFQVNNWSNKTDGKSVCTQSKAPFKVCRGGTWLRFAGETMTLNAWCTGATHFQWYKNGTAEENKIIGATDAIYTKVCGVGDGGYYYCKAWTVSGETTTSEAYGVRVPFVEYQTPPAPTNPPNGDHTIIPLTRVGESDQVATGTCSPGVAWTYAYSVTDGLGYHGNTGTMNSGNCTDWDMDNSSTWCRWETSKQGTYTFKVMFNEASFDPDKPYKVSVIYPPMKQTEGRPIYIENTATMNWNPDAIYYRIGKGQYGNGDERNWTAAQKMTLVPGTARYFKTTTPDWGSDFWAWHICNNRGDINQLGTDVWGGTKYSIYRTKVVEGNESSEITHSSNFAGDEVPDGGWTVYLTVKPEDEKGKIGDYNNNCYFHGYTHSPGMLTHSVAIGETENGQLRVEWKDENNTAQYSEAYTARSIADLAHTCILTVIAKPDNGYKLATLKINGENYEDGDTCIVQANKTILATFTEATYSVTLNLNTTDPTASINSDNVTEYTYPESVTLPVDVTRSGYTFLGWYDNSECTGSPITDIPASSWGNQQYWAKWEVGKANPVFTWSYGTPPLKAGGIYPVSVATNNTDAESNANVTLSIVGTIAGVTGSFTAGKPATGTVTLGSYPAASSFTFHAESGVTDNFYAKIDEKTVTIERCETEDAIPMAESEYVAESSASGTNARYYCEESGVGRISYKTGNSSISSSSFKSGTNDIFEYYIEGKTLLLEPYTDLLKVELYVNCGTNNQTLTGVYKRDTYSKEEDDYTTSASSTIKYYTGSTESTYLPYKTTGHVEIAFASPIPKGTFIYIVSPKQMNIYGAKLYRPEGDEPTSVEFSGEAEIEKYPGDAPFTNAATQTTTPVLSGGSITYKSSDETVATVDANTGEVTILDIGHTTITATLSAFGCFAQSTASYSLTVKKCTDPVCTIAVTAGNVNKCSTEDVTLTTTAATGATFQWYKDGVALSGKTGPSLTTKDAGEYYVEARKECLQVSNTITVTNFTAPTATALHDYYYIRAGRTTPDIALFQLTNVDVTDPDNAFEMNRPAPLGCAYELREDGIVYLTGTPDPTLTVDDYTITVTAKNPCGFGTAIASMHIYQIIQGKIAWVGCGNKGAGPANAIPESQGTAHPLYQYLSLEEHDFKLVPMNAYWTTDENQIRDYYSQFDLVLLTDYPATDKSPTKDENDRPHSYSNALGCLIDEKPILSLEAFVAGCPNWGINSNPKTPDPTQDKMTLLCSGHEIFAGTHLLPDEKITVLDAISGNGLQGFTGLEAPPGMLFIATIENKESNGGTLVVCCERQKVIEARMIIMGVNYHDMGNLNADGKLIIKQIIDYLLQFKELSDCALVFDDNHGTHVWSDPKNWRPTYTVLPKAFQAVRVDKPCNVDVTDAHCSSIRLRKHDSEGWNGTLTILPNGSLTVMDGITKVEGTNYMTTSPSDAADLVIKSGDQPGEYGRNGSLVFGNTEDDLQATVEYFSLAKDAKTSSPVWQYIGIPITDKPMAIDAYHAAWMCSWESEGNVSSNWVWVENEDRIQPFKGYCITQVESKKYTHIGSLSKPETKDLPLYYFESEDGNGFNMFSNSWVAPIDITKMETEDFGGAAEPTIFIYNTGTRAQYDEQYPDPLTDPIATDGKNTAPGQFNAIPVKAAEYLSGSLTKIPTMQGFFVQATKEGTLTLDYKKLCFNTETYATTAETMRAPKRVDEEAAEEPVTEKIVPEVMRLDVVSANWGDRLYILTHHEFSDAFDRGWDGSKQEGDEKAPMLALVRGNGLLAVAAVETAEERELLFRAGEDTEYTFSFAYEGERIYLYDRLAGKATEIKTGNTYSFTADNETAMPRFLITKNPPQVPTDIEQLDNGQWTMDNARKLIIDGVLYILRDNRFYDARGVRVTELRRKEVTP